MEWLITSILIIVAALYGYSQWGRSIEKKKQAKRVARDREKDAAISCHAPVDDPLDRM